MDKNSFWSPSAHFLETKKRKIIFMYRPKKGSPTIISVVSLSRMEVSLLLRLCYIHFQPVQAFLAPGLHFSEFSSLTEEKVPKRCLHTCLPSGFCQDTLVSS